MAPAKRSSEFASHVRYAENAQRGLEFELAADIVRSVISATWFEIGQLAATAVIRTFLNYFVEKDVEKYAEPRQETETQTLAKEAAGATR
jgi:uncharacterized membrane protein